MIVKISPEQIQANFEKAKAEKLAEFRVAREVILNQIVGIAFFADKSGDAALVTSCAAARAGLLALPQNPAVQASSDMPAFTAAVVQAYAAIAMAAPASLRQVLKIFKA